MQTFLQQLINGLSLGSIYALLALGYMIVYGISKLLNFAHGDVYMLGAYWGYYTINYLHFGFFTALITAMIACGLAGVIIEAVAYRPLRNAPRVAALITAIGVSFFLENGMSYLCSSDTRNFPQVIKRKAFDLGGVTISNIQLIILVTTIILMFGLMWIINYTKVGRAMRSVSTDYDAASLMGININHAVSLTFALGSALAGAAGVLIGLYYNSIDPLMGMTPGIKAFVAAVLGGIGSIPGAAVGGFLIGLLETGVTALGFSAFRDAAVYLVLIVILLVLPGGLFGKKQVEKV